MSDYPQYDSLEDDPPTASKITSKTGEEPPAWKTRVQFPEWQKILALEPLDTQTRERFAGAITVYLRIAKITMKSYPLLGRNGTSTQGFNAAHLLGPPCIGSSSPLAGARMPDNRFTCCRNSWRRHPYADSSGNATMGAELIRKIRLRGFLWNTEQIYRGWMKRFAARIAR